MLFDSEGYGEDMKLKYKELSNNKLEIKKGELRLYTLSEFDLKKKKVE